MQEIMCWPWQCLVRSLCSEFTSQYCQLCLYAEVGACLPGTLTGTHSLEETGVLEVKFSDGERYCNNINFMYGAINNNYYILQADSECRKVFLDKSYVFCVCC